MRQRSREEEAERQRRRRSKARSLRRTLKNVIIDDEETLRKALEAEGIHVSLSLEYAVIEKLRRICVEYKRGQAAKAWEAVAHLPVATTGILPRLQSSDEHPNVKKPRVHYNEYVPFDTAHWKKLSPEQQEAYWDEIREREEAAISDHIETEQRAALETRQNRDTGLHAGESRRVRAPSLDQVERGVRQPVPPKANKEPQE
jgi:hypothetical protein